MCYVVAQTQSTKKLKPTDIMKFDWDKQDKGVQHIEKERLQRLAAKMKELSKK